MPPRPRAGTGATGPGDASSAEAGSTSTVTSTATATATSTAIGTIELEPDADAPGDRPAVERELTSDPAPATRRRRIAKRKKSQSTNPDDPQPKVTFREANAGPAIWQKVIRWSVALVVLGFAAIGVIRTVNPPPVVTREDIVGVVDDELGRTGFPVEKGEAFAAQFVRTYFTWSAEGREERADQLVAFLPEGVPDGWDGHGAQQVVTTPTLAAPVQEDGADRATYTFSFLLDSGTWLRASVQVYADGKDNLIATGLPALLPGNGAAQFPGNPEFDQIDTKVADELVAVLPGFFEAWSASDAASLDRFVTADASTVAREGLHGAVVFDSVTDVSVEQPADDPDADTRHALATVTWRADPGEAKYTQTYLLTINLVDGRWYVSDLTVGQSPADEQSAPSTEAPPSSAGESGPGLQTIPPTTPPGADPPGPGG